MINQWYEKGWPNDWTVDLPYWTEKDWNEVSPDPHKGPYNWIGRDQWVAARIPTAVGTHIVVLECVSHRHSGGSKSRSSREETTDWWYEQGLRADEWPHRSAKAHRKDTP